MRKESLLIEKPRLRLHIEYDYLTTGELGNILIRFQAATRSIAGFGRGKYKYIEKGLEGRPLFVAQSVQTGKSIDISIILAIIDLVVRAPGILEALSQWEQLAKTFIRRLKIALYVLLKGEHPQASALEIPTGLTLSVTGGDIDFHAEREFLATLSVEQIASLVYLLHAFFGPARQVILGDEESEITISRDSESDPHHR
ncbi:hypothetical protein ES703_92491 [subsurface metagenome]